MDLHIVYEDAWLLIVLKPAGIPIHPSSNHYADSLSNGICNYYHEIQLHRKVRPVNRLDLYTSGLVIFAKSEYIQESLSKQMTKGLLTKEYVCIVNGLLEEQKGIIDLPIGRKPGSIIERQIDNTGQKSVTHFEVIRYLYDMNCTYVKCTLKTGRTHQIRIHMDAIGHTLLGDTLYGKASSYIERQALHSSKLKFIHPATQETVEITAPIPDDMKLLII